MGKTVIFTDQKYLNSESGCRGYDAQNQIENDIAWIKDKHLILLKPAYVKKTADYRLCP
jgi:hypothetical protein